jgi:hypothetical protein
MSNTIKDGGPAFPVLEYIKGVDGNIHPEPTIQSGMSLRDWFVGKAMQGLLANPEIIRPKQDENLEKAHERFAEVCGKYADCALAEREKVKP